MKPPSHRLRGVTCSVLFAMASGVSGTELVVLDATSLPNGPLVTWTNTGDLTGNFTRGSTTPSVTTVAGVNGVTLNGSSDWYLGPNAPVSLTGDGDRTVIAWLYNPSAGPEETVVAWGRRDGPDKSLAAFFHGYHDTWGCYGGWGTGDVGWANKEKTGAWTCCTWVYDSASGDFNAYTDGVLSTSKPVGPLATWAVSTSGGALPIRVGAQSTPSGGVTSINGSLTIARLRVYDTAFGAAEVMDAFSSEAAAFGLEPLLLDGLRASSTAVYRGDPVTLEWNVSGEDSLAMEPLVDVSGGSPVVIVPTETATYTLTAGRGAASASASVTVTVLPGLPETEDGSVTVAQDSFSAVNLVVSDPNPPAGGFAWEITAGPEHGSLTGTAPALTYTPEPGYHGGDSFSFRASDGYGWSGVSTITLLVNPPPSDPTDVSISNSVIASSSVDGSFIANLTADDPNYGETHSYQLVAGTGDDDNGLFIISGHQLIATTGFAGQAGNSFTIRVRVTDSTGRSFEQVIALAAVDPPQGVVINEIHYDPANNTRAEFVELHNPTGGPVDLSGWGFVDGIEYVFPASTNIPAGGYLVVAQDPGAFLNEFGYVPLGPYLGKLSGDGEKLKLVDASGAGVDEVDFRSTFPWPVSAGGAGPSMELVHPSLDNNLAGSWRASGSSGDLPELGYITAASGGWKWRTGVTEASSPSALWRQTGFSEDGTWNSYVSPIGYGDISSSAGSLPLNTVISGMRYNYRCVFLRKQFTIAPGEVPSSLLLRYCKDDGCVIWINGNLVAYRNMNTTEPTISTFAASDSDTEGLWYEQTISNASTFLIEGVNTVAVQVVNGTIGSSDLGFDMELIRPESSSVNVPTPGEANSVFAANAPPQIRQVGHSPEQPASGRPIVVTAKVTDPQGVGQVNLLYQIVAPGGYVPARFPRTVSQVLADPKGERPVNPAFEDPSNWTTLAMVDDGSGADETAADGVFTAVVPGQSHRTLVRYRIEAEDIPGMSVRVPYADDESLNFACFVYDGVPDYTAATASVSSAGAGKVWSKAMLTSLPVYHWITRHEDMMTLQAYNSWEQFPNTGDASVLAARRAEEWEGAFVYDGVVYDHVVTRLRGGNSRYGDNIGRFTNGKRHYKFRFHRGNYFEARDENGNPYPAKRKRLAMNRMYENKGTNGWGMPEEIGATLWRTFGVPAAHTDWVHFRVIDGASEAPDQYNGDFWGLTQVVEEYESGFLENRGMEKGNLYKMSDWIWDADTQRRYQSPDMVSDGSEFNNIRDNLHGAQNPVWLDYYVNYDKWYRYSAVAEGIRHYDVFPYIHEDLRHALKNLAWYFEPTGPDPSRGRCWFLPYDWDASFGPNWNNGWEHANNALYGWDMSSDSAPSGASYVDKPAMKLEHRNVLREFRDLVWQEDQVNGLIDDRAAVISGFSQADQDRWRNAPLGSGTQNDDPLPWKIEDMKNFCFVGWNGSTGPAVGAGGRGAHLDSLADAADAAYLPAKPVISYTGDPAHPVNSLSFASTAFSDPQGAGTFAAMEWRIGEVEDPTAPGWDRDADFIMEYTPVWLSGELTTFSAALDLPAGAVKPGHTYRARVRMKDNSGRWSHWSAAYQFTATMPNDLEVLQQNLMITEVMYNPAGPPPASGEEQDFEYLELRNISSTVTLDLTDVRFTKGVDFDFAGSAVTSLPPGAFVLVVKSIAAFEERYGSGLPVAGEWEAEDNLSNGGEQIKLSYGAGTAIHDFEYDDIAPWPGAADGDGPAMALIDPFSAPDHALAQSWAAADASPGTDGAGDPFGDWLASQGATDPMQDALPGMSWLMMYAIGADLAADPMAALPAAGFADDVDGKHLTISFRRRIDAEQVSYIVETSTVLDGWQSGGGVVEETGVPMDNGDGTETVTYRVVPTVDEDDARFIRLRVVLE
ncbi:MAG: lamin tail domain-containing protein [Akkermansiaceae bacterium]|nr:lamin tail domain-containing protein [Akkermansiaceae bacterium]MCP5542707.1 lamin tail domain-containing protein [Akkermansiaceae bacterium]MCP5548665.1 lamin tail domain-containing protein [Akkermansiaceae bacterium]